MCGKKVFIFTCVFHEIPPLRTQAIENYLLKIHKVSNFVFFYFFILYVYKGYVFNNFQSTGKVLIYCVGKFFFIFTCVFYDIPPFHYMLKKIFFLWNDLQMVIFIGLIGRNEYDSVIWFESVGIIMTNRS